MCIAEKKPAGENVVSLTSATGGGYSETSAGTIEAMLPQVSSERRDELHKMFALWIVRRRRPLKIFETDTELRDIFDYIFRGAYKPPSYKLVTQKILDLSAEARIRTQAEIAAVLADGVLVSIAGDIWSEGGISLFGILAYWIDVDFNLQERLLGAIPFSDVRHTGSEILTATKKACAVLGLGVYDDNSDTVKDFVHCTASDSASNIVSGWEEFDGHECNCHILALCVLVYLKSYGVKEVFKKLRGMTTHFSHNIIGVKLLHSCQEKNDLAQTCPPKDNDTRTGWGGAFKQSAWYRVQQHTT
ncbi:hypothetical protein CYMTET_38486 [Cymbomonas tetramitiformis]|uniref:Uncharacterized protein n=1 Tax=Cymbomonas tetramitiformis TaxID=36881 RepID=A0AAE0F5M8_9CHLO|nr:hypothetical protein CYMTET_38486 [Cymbomonas tetramitiformis]